MGSGVRVAKATSMGWSMTNCSSAIGAGLAHAHQKERAAVVQLTGGVRRVRRTECSIDNKLLGLRVNSVAATNVGP